jgi:hypothetical protein
LRNPGLTLVSVTSVDSTHIYVGSYADPGPNALLKWNGSAWQPVDTGTQNVELTIYTLVQNAPNDAYAGGYYVDRPSNLYGSILLHFNGNSWTNITPPDCSYLLRSMAIISPGNIWLNCKDRSAGQSFVHFDGAQWSAPQMTPSIQKRMVDFGDGQLLSIGRRGDGYIMRDNVWSKLKMPGAAHTSNLDVTRVDARGWMIVSGSDAVVLRKP